MNRTFRPAGIRALAIELPSRYRTITLPNGDSAMRHALSDGLTGLDLDRAAAEEALRAAKLDPSEIDLVLGASFPALPEPCIGNATPMAWDMGMERAAAWNVESACASGLVALRSACQEVMVGEYDNVLVVVGCPYSHTVEPGHPATDVIGDAAFAMVIGPTAEGQELLGSVVRNSGPTCSLVSWSVDLAVPSGIRLAVGHKTAGQLEEWALKQLPELVAELFSRAGVSVADVDHWVCNAPTPRFVDRAISVMGGDPEHGVNTNRLVGNVGPALIGVSLYYNAILRDFQPGDLVACCSVGSEASLALSLMRWPENVALGKEPATGTVEQMRAFEAERFAVAVG
ncbi:MAG: 3-oxoacyl-[acyl-carrier-protein] synthase III C-terminal domain-containing protein [Acidobacteriota bacterium]